MDATEIIIVLIAVVVAAGLLLWFWSRSRQSKQLRERFGPEYDHAVEEAGRRDAERQLVEVERRHENLDLRTLPATTRERYLDEWRQTESRFVSDPADAVRGAERIVVRVLEERGYPIEGDPDRSAVHVAADYPDLAHRYRRAHEMAASAERGTENLRLALIDLRVVLDELLAPPERTTA
jgi:FtsZ-interacting cell division protein ZipA